MFNPIPKTKMLLMMIVDLDPGLTLTSIDSKNKLLIAKETFPNTEELFKKFFTTCEWEKANPKQKEQIHISCTLNGNCTLTT